MTDTTDRPTLVDRIRDAITDPAAVVGTSPEEETTAEWATRAVLAVLAAEPDRGPETLRHAVRYAQAVRAVLRAYREAGGVEHASEVALAEAINAGLGVAELHGRLQAAAAIRAFDRPGRSRLIPREAAAQIAEDGTTGVRHTTALAALMDRIPAPGEVWFRRDRDLLVETFGNMLDLFHPTGDRSRQGVPVATVPAGDAAEVADPEEG